ncbi:hypothetical protein [Zoogloea sp.]|uniref:hypothetical protein n=1 Tax=Zoogloea sp. TaxID=49181 RepID=UPI001416D69B|nr:MAG: hypothetical protein F9K15_23475 [Zoogloea sp.]
MRPPNTHYTQFKLLYQDGLRRLEEVRLPPEAWEPGPAAERAWEVTGEALARLNATPFGATLFETRVLTNAFDALNDGLWQCVDAAVQAGDLPTSDPAYIWSMERYYEAERRLRFFGEVGALYHYFRDLGCYLDTTAERSLRRQYLENSTALVQQLDDMLGHVGIHLTYEPHVVKQMQNLLHVMKTLNRDLDAPRDAGLTEPNPLQAGDTIIRRQFVRSVCLLSFKLFGCITPGVLDDFLELKSSTAEALGLEAWSHAVAGHSRNWKVRTYIGQALKTGKSMATKQNWVTRPVLAYFATHRGVMFAA